MKAIHSSKRSSKVAKRLWNFLRITFIMVRKGLISKKKLIMDINLFFKRGRLIRKSLNNLLHQQQQQQMTRGGGFAQREYEFSCSNSPNPVFFHVSSSNHHHIRLPCMKQPVVADELELECEDKNNAIVLVPKTPEYTFNLRLDPYDISSGEISSPLTSPFPIMIADYSSEDENSDAGNTQVDDDAEEFINKFYQQLRAQRRVQLLQY